MKHSFRIGLFTVLTVLSASTFAQKKPIDYEKSVNRQEVMRKATNQKLNLQLKSKTNEDSIPMYRVSSSLEKFYKIHSANNKSSTNKKLEDKNTIFRTEDRYILKDDKIHITIITSAKEVNAKVKKELLAIGMDITDENDNVIAGYISTNNIPKLEEIPNIEMAKPSIRGVVSGSGIINRKKSKATFFAPTGGEANKALRADIARQLYNVDGNHIKIGIISDSYNSLGGANASVGNGDLPGTNNPLGYTKPVQVLQDFINPVSVDEGRAMAELIHDIAPGAEIFFHTGFPSSAAFVTGVAALRNAGCDIIVDDINYGDQPIYQDGRCANAVNEAVNAGVTYFSAAGNAADNAYEGFFTPTNITDVDGSQIIAHRFGTFEGQPIVRLPFIIAPGRGFSVLLQWAERFKSVSGGAGARNDYDLYFYDNDLNIIGIFDDSEIGGDPNVGVGLGNPAGNTNFLFYVSIVKKSGTNNFQRIKFTQFSNGGSTPLFFRDDAQFVPGLFSSTTFGHPNADKAITVGASYYKDSKEYSGITSIPETFSSTGGSLVVFNYLGNVRPSFRIKPDITATDGTNTSFFTTDRDGDGLPNFSGTSAAAPNAAAVAALAFENSSCGNRPSQFLIKNLFRISTEDMDNPNTPNFDFGYDVKTGFGYLKADQLLSYFDFCNFNKNSKNISAIPKIETAFDVFPNPATSLITIQLKEGIVSGSIVTVTDASGAVVINKSVNNSIAKGNITTVDVSKLTPGMYLVSLKSGNKIFTKKIIKP